MGKINWKLRLKNKYTLIALVSAIALFINNVTQAFGVDYSAQVEQGVSIVTSVITFLAGIGIVVDGTTKGFGDSPIAQEYTEPRDATKENNQLDWSNQIDKQEQWIDGSATQVNETVDGVRDVDQKEIEEEQANQAPIGLEQGQKPEYTQAPNSDPFVKEVDKNDNK